nr:hypothetical protein [Methylocystis sp. ATCC 49242]
MLNGLERARLHFRRWRQAGIRRDVAANLVALNVPFEGDDIGGVHRNPQAQIIFTQPIEGLFSLRDIDGGAKQAYDLMARPTRLHMKIEIARFAVACHEDLFTGRLTCVQHAPFDCGKAIGVFLSFEKVMVSLPDNFFGCITKRRIVNPHAAQFAILLEYDDGRRLEGRRESLIGDSQTFFAGAQRRFALLKHLDFREIYLRFHRNLACATHHFRHGGHAERNRNEDQQSCDVGHVPNLETVDRLNEKINSARRRQKSRERRRPRASDHHDEQRREEIGGERLRDQKLAQPKAQRGRRGDCKQSEAITGRPR